MSSPVNNATAPTGYTYFKYDEPGNNSNLDPAGTTAYWESVTAGSGTLNPTTGYIVQVPSGTPTITFSGTALNTNDKDIVLSRTAGKTKEGFNLVGNPYPSFLDISNLSSNTDIESTVWYRINNGGYNFDTYNITSAVTTGNSGLAVTSYIPPMQAFWVRVASGKSTATINLLNANRGHQDNINNKFRAPAQKNLTQQLVRLQVSNGLTTDEAVLYSNPNASDNFDNYDSEKMFNNSISVAELYLKADTNKLVIDGLKSIPINTEIPLGFSTLKKGSNSYSIKASELSNLSADTQVILKDNQNLSSPENDITSGTPYTFTSDSVTTESRFSVIFKSTSIASGLNAEISNNILVYKNANNQITISNLKNLSGNVHVYNSLGQIITEKPLNGIKTVIDRPLKAGIYIVTVSDSVKNTTKKVILD
jgi:hypothetical protein